jgi:prepilin-type N-terminal cleavage/methylation domain-containing protein
MANTAAFTLIELLVVVTIIVVLLALLTPALDRAIYQAELAVCGSNQHAAVVGLLTYTGEYRRWYPNRKGVVSGSDWQHAKFFDSVNTDQRLVAPYVDINKTFNDPLSQPVDYEANPQCHAYTPYSLWWGYRFANERGMNKLGDRWTWTNTVRGQVEMHDVLISDLDYVADGSQTVGGHPDAEGVRRQYTRENEDQEVAVPGGGGAMAPFPVNKMVMSLWMSDIGVHQRGPIDYLAGAEDGSVRQYRDVAWDDLLPANAEGPLRSVDWNMTTRYWPGLRATVPIAP